MHCGIKVVFNILEWIPHIPQDLAVGRMAISAVITVPLITIM